MTRLPMTSPHRLPLSDRETSVLKLIAWGYGNKDIAVRLGISVKTVEAHRYTALRKLRLQTRVDVVRYGLECGWLRLDAPEFQSAGSAEALGVLASTPSGRDGVAGGGSPSAP